MYPPGSRPPALAEVSIPAPDEVKPKADGAASTATLAVAPMNSSSSRRKLRMFRTTV